MPGCVKGDWNGGRTEGPALRARGALPTVGLARTAMPLRPVPRPPVRPPRPPLGLLLDLMRSSSERSRAPDILQGAGGAVSPQARVQCALRSQWAHLAKAAEGGTSHARRQGRRAKRGSRRAPPAAGGCSDCGAHTRRPRLPGARHDDPVQRPSGLLVWCRGVARGSLPRKAHRLGVPEVCTPAVSRPACSRRGPPPRRAFTGA